MPSHSKPAPTPTRVVAGFCFALNPRGADMDHRSFLPRAGACKRHSGLACTGCCQASDPIVASVLLGMLDTSFTHDELSAWHHAATAAMLDR